MAVPGEALATERRANSLSRKPIGGKLVTRATTIRLRDPHIALLEFPLLWGV